MVAEEMVPVWGTATWGYEDTYEWLWLYVAVAPLSSDGFFLLLPHVNADCLQICAERFGHEMAGQRVGLAMGGSGSHNCGKAAWPEGVLAMRLPPCSPELHPDKACSGPCGPSYRTGCSRVSTSWRRQSPRHCCSSGTNPRRCKASPDTTGGSKQVKTWCH